MIVSIHSFVLSLVLLFAPLYQDANILLNELQQKYETIENFKADFRQITGDGHVSTGTFSYKSKDKFRIEVDNRMLLSDGESIWNYTPKTEKVIISPIEENGTSFSMDDYIYEYPANCTVSNEKDEGYDVLILKPKNADLDFKEVRLWISDERVVEQLQLIDLMKNRFKVVLSNIKLNTDLSDDSFSFSPKDGMQVIDLR